MLESPRVTKSSDLLSGKYGGIQAHTITEVPTFRRQLEEGQLLPPLEPGRVKRNGTKLGYGQVLFAADE